MSNKRRKIRYNRGIEDDEIKLSEDTDVEMIKTIGPLSINGSFDVYDKLLDIAGTERQKRLRLDDGTSIAVIADEVKPIKEDLVEYVCENCLHSFFIKPDNKKHHKCPVCGGKSHSAAELEEVSLMGHGFMTNDQAAIFAEMVRDEERRRRAEILDSNNDTSDDAKEQISLEQGSIEFKAYKEDLEDSHPSKPDDEMHAELEKHNEDLITKNYDMDADNEHAAIDERDKAKNMTANMLNKDKHNKIAWHDFIKAKVIILAGATETLEDDKAAKELSIDNDMIYDQSIKADEYEANVEELIL